MCAPPMSVGYAYLFSGSSDKTIKVWARTKGDDDIVEIYTCSEDHPVVTFMHDAAAEPHLFVSCTTHFSCAQELDLADQGELFVSREVTTVAEGDGPHFFTGDTSGNVDVWKWLGQTICCT